MGMLSTLQLLTDFGIAESNPVLYFILLYLPFIIFMLYGQKLQTWMILNDVSRSLGKLKVMKEKGRKEAIGYVANTLKSSGDPTERVDQFLEYFTIQPVDLDPSGVVRKIEHVMTIHDERMRSEVRKLSSSPETVQTTAAENILEAATSLNLIYKIVRHFYLIGKKTTSLYVLVQLQMILPTILQEADAMISAIDAFKQAQPIGDGVGAMVAGKLMLPKDKRVIARDTVIAESEYKNRLLYLIKAEGPGGTVGQPGSAVEKLISEMGVKVDSIIMIDAALKLEGEKTGETAEGIGAAIGGIGVDRFKIEEVASKNNIPLYAVVIKQSLIDAISVMKKEIAEAADKVLGIVYRVIEDKTKEGQSVLIVGVGNTLGVGQ